MRYSSPVALRLPDKLPAEGLLVGWSLEDRPSKRTIGFTYGNSLKNPDTGYLHPILLEGEGHLMTIAPTGSGKGTGCIIPTLLRYPGPVIVIDPKGENVAITARRRRELGQRVVVIDPMGLTQDLVGQASDTLNPLDAIDVDQASAVDEVTALVQMLNQELDEDVRNRFWSNRGMHLVIGVVLQALLEAKQNKCEATLLQVRDLIGAAVANPAELNKRLKASPHPEVRRIASALGIKAEETMGSYLAFAQELLDFLRGDQVQANIATSSFELNEVTAGVPLSIYLVLPPHMLESHRRLLRLWLGALIGCITRRRARPELSTLFILDEAAQLGELSQFRQAVTLLRGYGMQTWSFWQDSSQLQLLYPHDWLTMVNNCRVLQCFGALNQVAAEGMARLTGYGNGSMVLDLEPDEMVLQLGGDEAVIAKVPNYLRDPAFAGQYDRNPYHDRSRPVMPRTAAPQRMYARPDKAPPAPLIGLLPEEDALLAQLMDKSRRA